MSHLLKVHVQVGIYGLSLMLPAPSLTGLWSHTAWGSSPLWSELVVAQKLQLKSIKLKLSVNYWHAGSARNSQCSHHYQSPVMKLVSLQLVHWPHNCWADCWLLAPDPGKDRWKAVWCGALAVGTPVHHGRLYTLAVPWGPVCPATAPGSLIIGLSSRTFLFWFQIKFHINFSQSY